MMYPNSELVTIGWIKTIPNVPSGQVATTVPAVDNQGFRDNGFIQVTAVGGVPNQDTFMQNATMQIDVYAFNADSNKVPWGKAYHLAMLIKEGLKEAARVIETPVQYHDAYVHEVRVLVDPRRIMGDESSFARYSFDVQVHWTVRELVA